MMTYNDELCLPAQLCTQLAPALLCPHAERRITPIRAARIGGSKVSTINPDTLAAIVAQAVAAALAGTEGNVPASEPKPKRGGTTRSSAGTSTRRTSGPKSSAARKPAKPAPTEWVVRESWAGVKPSPRMLGAALHYGLTPAKVAKLDKLALSCAIATHRGIPIKREA